MCVVLLRQPQSTQSLLIKIWLPGNKAQSLLLRTQKLVYSDYEHKRTTNKIRKGENFVAGFCLSHIQPPSFFLLCGIRPLGINPEENKGEVENNSFPFKEGGEEKPFHFFFRVCEKSPTATYTKDGRVSWS